VAQKERKTIKLPIVNNLKTRMKYRESDIVLHYTQPGRLLSFVHSARSDSTFLRRVSSQLNWPDE